MGDRYKALVEADCIIVPRQEFESAEEAEAYLEENVNTGHLGPVNVRGVEVDDSASESSSRTDSDGQSQEVDDAHSDSGGGG